MVYVAIILIKFSDTIMVRNSQQIYFPSKLDNSFDFDYYLLIQIT